MTGKANRCKTVLVHEGIRPKGETSMINHGSYKGCVREELDGGGYRVWTDKMLKSGCGGLSNSDVRLNGLIYCRKCDEFFSEEQFEERV